MSASVYQVSREEIHATFTMSVTIDQQPVEVAFISGTGTPDDATVWYPAEWVGDPATARVWQILIGPDTTVQLPKGQYMVYTRVTDATERPVRANDTLAIK